MMNGKGINKNWEIYIFMPEICVTRLFVRIFYRATFIRGSFPWQWLSVLARQVVELHRNLLSHAEMSEDVAEHLVGMYLAAGNLAEVVEAAA